MKTACDHIHALLHIVKVYNNGKDSKWVNTNQINTISAIGDTKLFLIMISQIVANFQIIKCHCSYPYTHCTTAIPVGGP